MKEFVEFVVDQDVSQIEWWCYRHTTFIHAEMQIFIIMNKNARQNNIL